ncbi:MAG TPA: MDR family MFS transporter [Acetobacteraceae bacterium]|nr:MDR family MFS transporter [Acetobacteraceae bacterium]
MHRHRLLAIPRTDHPGLMFRVAGKSVAALPARAISGRFIALIVASALFMEQLDSTVLSTALPAMARAFHADPVHMSTALTAYLLSLAVFIPASGKIADRLGSRTVFRAAIVLFTLGSILCGQANGLVFLICARVLQGLGGAMMVPVGRLVLVRSVPKAELVSAMAWLLVPALIGPVVGPPLGGFIVTYLSWRWIFYINVPIGILGVILVSLYIEDVKEPEPGPFDRLGLLLSGVSLACLMFGLDMGSHGALSLPVLGVILVVGFGAGAAYVAHALSHPRPVMDLRLMRIPTFRVSIVSGTLFRIGVGAMPFLLPMMLQLDFGMSAAQSGMITFVSAAGSMMMKTLAPRLLRRFGFRETMLWNGLISSALFALCAGFRPDWPVAALYGVLLVGGFFRSLQFTAYGTIAFADIPRPQMSDATSFFSTFQQLSATLGIALSAATLEASVALHGHTGPMLSDFSITFVVVAAISLFAVPACYSMAPTAGAELSGQRARKRQPSPLQPSSAATPGRVLPSIHSRNAPPAEET